MKKKLFLALLTTLLFLLAATGALASSAEDTCTHPNISHWQDWDAEQHFRQCPDCAALEFESHAAPTEWFPYDATQHTRLCSVCRGVETRELEDHYGGTATCILLAECEVCNAVYGEADSTNHREFTDWMPGAVSTEHYRACIDCGQTEYGSHTDQTGDGMCDVCGYELQVPCQHANMSPWLYFDGTQHVSYCLDCNAYETYQYSNHTGGTATCTNVATCEVCENTYGGLSTTNHGEFTDWIVYDLNQHYRYCVECGGNFEYSSHTGGTATCMELAVCDVCGEGYGELDTTRHINMSDWTLYDADQHYRYCEDCYDPAFNEYAPHAGGDGSCLPNCKDCGDIYSDANGRHDGMSDWFWYDDAQHYRYCEDCGYGHEYAAHTGGKATCTNVATCEVCGNTYGDYATEHTNMSEWTSESATRHHRYCEDCGEDEFANHADSSGDGLCDDCGYTMAVSCLHSNLTDWINYSDTQHYRYCLSCGMYEEHGNHTGGEATCTSKAVCDVCGEGYGELDPNNHSDLGMWVMDGHTEHYRYCYDCDTYERGNHIGDDDSCNPTCTVCNQEYLDQNGKHASWSGWSRYDALQHRRSCLTCSVIDYADHTGGTATCLTQADCEACGASYGEYAAHTITAWKVYNNTEHFRYCSVCGGSDTFQYEAHTGGTATCTAKASCKVCDQAYGDYGAHTNITDWTYADATEHYRYCLDCRSDASMETAAHSGGTATCSKRAVCDDCDTPYGDFAAHANYSGWQYYTDSQHYRLCLDCNDPGSFLFGDHTGGAATCTEKAICTVCSKGYGESLGHDWGEWVSDGKGSHTRTCKTDATHTETARCSGGAATCTAQAICEVCSTAYGDTLGHDWVSGRLTAMAATPASVRTTRPTPKPRSAPAERPPAPRTASARSAMLHTFPPLITAGVSGNPMATARTPACARTTTPTLKPWIAPAATAPACPSARAAANSMRMRTVSISTCLSGKCFPSRSTSAAA